MSYDNLEAAVPDDDEVTPCEVPGCTEEGTERVEREGPMRCVDHYAEHLHEIGVLPWGRFK